MSLEFSGRCIIQHINSRKEGPDDAKELAIDVKVTLYCEPVVLGFFHHALDHFLFDAGTLRFPPMGAVAWDGQMQSMDVELAGVVIRGVTLKKFSLAPVRLGNGDPRVEVTCSFSFRPEGNELAILAELLQDNVAIAIAPQSALPLGPQ